MSEAAVDLLAFLESTKDELPPPPAEPGNKRRRTEGATATAASAPSESAGGAAAAAAAAPPAAAASVSSAVASLFASSELLSHALRPVAIHRTVMVRGPDGNFHVLPTADALPLPVSGVRIEYT